MLRGYRGSRGQVQLRRYSDAVAAVAAAEGLRLSANQVAQLVYKYGPEAIKYVREQARNPRSKNTLERKGLFIEADNPASSAIVPNKRRLPFEVPQAMDQDMLSFGGSSQMQYSKKVLGKRKKPYNILKRFVSRMKNDCICRWQSLSTWGTNSGTLLSHSMKIFNWIPTPPGNITYMTLPVFAFNLSGPPMWSQGAGPSSGPEMMYPMYQLVQRITAPVTYKYQWFASTGMKNNEDGTTDGKGWCLEHIENRTENQAKIKSDDYTHDWSQVKLILQGSRKYPVRYHLYVMQFLQDGVGPQRESADGVIDTNPTEETLIGTANYFWDRFLLPKVTHPLANTKKVEVTDPRVRVLHHEVVSIGPEISISEDLQPKQVFKNFFYRNGTHYKGNSSSEGGAADISLTVDLKPEFHDADTGEYQLGIVDRNKDRWFVVVAENYMKDGTGVNDTPSFDIAVRSKYTLYDI